MRTSSLIILITLLVQFSKATLGQSRNSIDSLLCREWKLVSFEDEEGEFSVLPELKNYRIIFYANHSVEIIEPETIEKGIWKYDSKKKIVTISYPEMQEMVLWKISKISKDEFILGINDSEGDVFKMHMVPVTTKK